MVHWLSTHAKEQLVNDQQKKMTQASIELDLESIMFVSDKLLLRFFAEFCMPKTRNEYQCLMIKHCDSLKNIDFEFGLNGFSRVLHAPVEKVLRQITHYDNFLRNHATSQELSQLPRLAYGSESDPQAFFI